MAYVINIFDTIFNDMITIISATNRKESLTYKIATSYSNLLNDLNIENQINFLEEENIRVSIHNLLQFPIIKKMVKNKKLSIFGLIYDISSGDIKSL